MNQLFSIKTTIDLLYRDKVTYLRGTRYLWLARIPRLLDKRPAFQLLVLWYAMGLEDVCRVLQERVLHRLARQRAELCRRWRNLSAVDDHQVSRSTLGGRQLPMGAVSTVWARHVTVSVIVHSSAGLTAYNSVYMNNVCRPNTYIHCSSATNGIRLCVT